MRICPTRTDGRAALFAHKVSQAQCQSRQRGQYHKCFTCAYANATVAKFGMPEARAVEELELEVTTGFAALPRLPELSGAAESGVAEIAEAPSGAPSETPGETPGESPVESSVESSVESPVESSAGPAAVS